MAYSKCQQADHEIEDVIESATANKGPKLSTIMKSSPFGFWLVQGLIFMFSASVLLLGLFSRRSCLAICETHADVAWSPVIDFVKPRMTKFNETYFFETKFPSPFYGSPSPAVDDVWRTYTMHPMLDGRNGTLAVPRATVEKLGRSHEPGWMDSMVKLVHGGEERYMATLDIYHHVHCLNMLREVAHPNYYTNKDPTQMEGHLDHCIETVREALMCNAGTGVAMFHWIKGDDQPWPDYNTLHQCRDPEMVLEWSLQNAVPVQGSFTKPEGALELPLPLY
ncbi:hypothetical protein BJ878DRAFT_246986 [Calycina marina]|uniref:Uncharacterized protein n=1 Tax=Calycina marina TaxID=1763456 RepID=A0A9P7Z7U6_9HELO|nr:hypothetical protein BJ878DRAFT_246986 [Calycina marina]